MDCLHPGCQTSRIILRSYEQNVTPSSFENTQYIRCWNVCLQCKVTIARTCGKYGVKTFLASWSWHHEGYDDIILMSTLLSTTEQHKYYFDNSTLSSMDANFTHSQRRSSLQTSPNLARWPGITESCFNSLLVGFLHTHLFSIHI